MVPKQRGWYEARNALGVLRTVFLVPESGNVYLVDAAHPQSADDWHSWIELVDLELPKHEAMPKSE